MFYKIAAQAHLDIYLSLFVSFMADELKAVMLSEDQIQTPLAEGSSFGSRLKHQYL
jgi:hypothetical protein